VQAAIHKTTATTVTPMMPYQLMETVFPIAHLAGASDLSSDASSRVRPLSVERLRALVSWLIHLTCIDALHMA
jgi:hypothetical protein